MSAPRRVGRERVVTAPELARLRAERLGLGRQLQAVPERDAVTREPGHVGGGDRRVDQPGERRRAPQVEVRVVLPRVPDAAVDLDVHLRGPPVGGERDAGRDRGREPPLGFGAIRAPDRVPRGGVGELGVDQHLRAVVLDRLEGRDDPAELLAHERVPDRGVEARRARRPRPPRLPAHGRRASRRRRRPGRPRWARR